MLPKQKPLILPLSHEIILGQILKSPHKFPLEEVQGKLLEIQVEIGRLHDMEDRLARHLFGAVNPASGKDLFDPRD
jgi:hypothetical protein